MATLTLGLRNLERQLDTAFPNRRRPDGWIGDEAHRKRTSGHNPDDTPGSRPAWDGDPDTLAEVRALDVAADLGDGATGQQLVDHLVRLPKLARVVRYLIHRGRIWHERNGFEPQDFDGDPHDDHVHIEGAWSQSADNNCTFNYRLEAIPVALTADDKAWISAEIRKVVTDDADPSARTYSLGGMVTTIERRTDALANTDVPALAAKVDQVLLAVTPPVERPA